MRVSPRRHVLVLLREAIGISQKAFAKAVEIGESTLQKIELGTYPLRRPVAEKITNFTGVDKNYLIRNDSREPLLNRRGEEYSRADFEAAQGQQKPLPFTDTHFHFTGYKSTRLTVTTTFLDLYHQARTIFLGDPNAWQQFHRCFYRLHQVLQETVDAIGSEQIALFERVSKEHHQRDQKERLLTTKGDIEEVLDVLEILEKRDRDHRDHPIPPAARERLLTKVEPRHSRDDRARVRRVSSSPNSARK
jgi:transcriptional regulator with XRE-family HTH domain